MTFQTGTKHGELFQFLSSEKLNRFLTNKPNFELDLLFLDLLYKIQGGFKTRFFITPIKTKLYYFFKTTSFLFCFDNQLI